MGGQFAYTCVRGHLFVLGVPLRALGHLLLNDLEDRRQVWNILQQRVGHGLANEFMHQAASEIFDANI